MLESMLLDDQHVERLAGKMLLNQTHSPDHYMSEFQKVGGHGTTHLNVVDGHRNVVAITSSINHAFGSFLVSEQTGVLFNNDMNDFTITPDDANSFGLPPSKANVIGWVSFPPLLLLSLDLASSCSH